MDNLNRKKTNVVELKVAEPISKPVIYRSERIRIPDNIHNYLEIKQHNGTSFKLKIKDVSAFGVRGVDERSENSLVLNERVHLSIYFNDQELFQDNGQIVNEFINEGVTSYGISFADSYIDIENLRSIVSNNSRIESLHLTKSLVPSISNIKPEFKILMSDLNCIFKEIKNKIEIEEENINHTALNDQHKERMKENLVAMAVSLNLQLILDKFNQFQDIVDTFSVEENFLHKKYFRIVFADMINRTPFLKRAFDKPLGYAGDYGLMLMFYDYKDLGDSMFYKFMHRLSCNQPVAVANKNRVEFLSQLIQEKYDKVKGKQKLFKIVSVACGPAQELNLFLKDLEVDPTCKIEVIIVDQESKALDYAIDTLKKLERKNKSISVTAFKEDAIMGILKKRPFMDYSSEADVIVCAGLYDYLSERVANKLTEALSDYIKQGGSLIIGNVSNEHPNRFSMEYFMEWNLVLRSAAQMTAMISKEKRESSRLKPKVISESLGINLFLEVLKE